MLNFQEVITFNNNPSKNDQHFFLVGFVRWSTYYMKRKHNVYIEIYYVHLSSGYKYTLEHVSHPRHFELCKIWSIFVPLHPLPIHSLQYSLFPHALGSPNVPRCREERNCCCSRCQEQTLEPDNGGKKNTHSSLWVILNNGYTTPYMSHEKKTLLLSIILVA